MFQVETQLLLSKRARKEKFWGTLGYLQVVVT
jgi:hypothetical protein